MGSGIGPRADLRSLARGELDDLIADLRERPFRARQVFRWLHHRGVATLEEMSDLPRSLREALAARFSLTTLQRDAEQRSADGTIKWRWRTDDGLAVESVYMPEPERKTLCVSSQVGCGMGCTFCRTATLGLTRNLTPGEIVDQVHRANRRLVELGEGEGPRPLTNLVFMGMGEPLANFENLKAALAILLSEDGPNFSHRHVTVSTAGLAPMIERLGAETRVKLAVSLNATTDEGRTRIMPINRRWPIAELLRACRAFPMKQGRRITFEYVMLAGENDSDADADRLSRLLGALPAKVNLIPFNEGAGVDLAAPSVERVEAFRERLARAGITAVVRRSRGRDIAAACGQLAAAGGAARGR